MSKVLIFLFLFTLLLFLFYFTKALKWVFDHRFVLLIVFLTTGYVVFASFFFHQKDVHEIVRGLQSSIIPMCFLLVGSFIGYVTTKGNRRSNFVCYLFYFLFFILVGSILWQLGKHIFPDLFFSLGFGPVGDWHPNVPPPIYFRTGPGGVARLSGLFSGPNNYGYFLIVFFPFFLLLLRSTFFKFLVDGEKFPVAIPKFLVYSFLVLFFVSGILTLSRGVLLGWIVAFFSSWFSGSSFSQAYEFLRKFFFQKKVLVGVFLCLVFLFGFLSWYKLGSTVGHVKHRIAGLEKVFENPWFGYGLGSSGPGVHYTGFILPENFYLQLWLDGGIFYLLLRVFCVVVFVNFYKRYDTYRFLLGFLGLLLVGCFLHIFEDTMVNLLMCLPIGFLRGSEKATKDSEKAIENF